MITYALDTFFWRLVNCLTMKLQTFQIAYFDCKLLKTNKTVLNSLNHA